MDSAYSECFSEGSEAAEQSRHVKEIFDMTFYTENREFVQKYIESPSAWEVNAALYTKCLKICAAIFGGILMLMTIIACFDGVELRVVGGGASIAVIAPVLFVYLCRLIMLMAPNMKKQYRNTITLDDSKVTLRDWDDRTIRECEYSQIVCAEVVIMRGPVQLPAYRSRDKKQPYICLHTNYKEIPIGARTYDYRNKTDRVLIFAYDSIAWNLLNEHLPDNKIIPWNEANN